MSDFLALRNGTLLRLDQIASIRRDNALILFHPRTGPDLTDAPYATPKDAAAALSAYAATLASSFLALPAGPLLSIANIASVSRLRNQVLFTLSTGRTIADTYADLPSAAAAAAAYQSALAAASPGGALSLTALFPALFDLAQQPAAGFPAFIIGSGFSAANTPTLLFRNSTNPGSTFTTTAGGITVLSSTLLRFNLHEGLTYSDLAFWNAEYYEDHGSGSVLLQTLTSAFQILQSRVPTVYDPSNAAPPAPQPAALQTVDVQFVGSTSPGAFDTLYLWDTSNFAWRQLV